MRSLVIIFVMACGGGSKPEVENTARGSAEPVSPPIERTCQDAIEGWFFMAGVNLDKRPFLDACANDRWSEQTRECFKYLPGTPAVGRTEPTPTLAQCKATFTPAQLASYRRLIELYGQPELDQIE